MLERTSRGAGPNTILSLRTPSRRVTAKQAIPGRSADPGLGRHLRRDGAVPSSVREAPRHLGQGRAYQRVRVSPVAIRSRRRAATTIRSDHARAARRRNDLQVGRAKSSGYKAVHRGHPATRRGPPQIRTAMRLAPCRCQLRPLREVHLRGAGQGHARNPALSVLMQTSRTFGVQAALPHVLGIELRPAGFARDRRALSPTSSPARSTSSRPISWRCAAFTMTNTRLLLMAGLGEPYDPATGPGRGGPQLLLPDQRGRRVFVEDRWIVHVPREREAPACRSTSSTTTTSITPGPRLPGRGRHRREPQKPTAARSGNRRTPPDTPRCRGRKWKRRPTQEWYAHSFSGCRRRAPSYPHRENHLEGPPVDLARCPRAAAAAPDLRLARQRTGACLIG